MLATEGAVPVIVGRDEADDYATVAALIASGRVGQMVAELSEPAACARAVQAVLGQYNWFNELVNNAGANDGVGLETGDHVRFLVSLH